MKKTDEIKKPFLDRHPKTALWVSTITLLLSLLTLIFVIIASK